MGSGAVPPVPTQAEIHAVIPDHCFDRRLSTSLRYAVQSVLLTLLAGWLGWHLLPTGLVAIPAWIAYSLIAGTLATGVWVVAHECGHGAFCDNKRLQDGIGFVLHSALLVPYFSWQRSHAIHHAKTNHVVQGESHVPHVAGTTSADGLIALRRRLGRRPYAAQALTGRLVAGWPVYLMTGATGGPERGTTNHFWPGRPFSDALFPARLRRRVLWSSAGVATTLAVLIAAAVLSGRPLFVLALYSGPYLVCNAWLVAYTWLQHTGEDVPHYDDADWSYVRGAFCTVDRPYGRLFDLVHHRIGSTHVAHHLVSRIPHYHAREATDAVAAAFPHLYRYDPTPVPVALWRAAERCVVVHPTDDGYRFG